MSEGGSFSGTAIAITMGTRSSSPVHGILETDAMDIASNVPATSVVITAIPVTTATSATISIEVDTQWCILSRASIQIVATTIGVVGVGDASRASAITATGQDTLGGIVISQIGGSSGAHARPVRTTIAR